MEYNITGRVFQVRIFNSSSVALFSAIETNVDALAFPRTISLNAVSGSGATGTCILNIDVAQLYARMISDSPSILGTATVELPSDDIVDNNRNYGRVAPVSESGDLSSGISAVLSSTPTEWGIYQPGEYYTQPLGVLSPTLPICRSRWSRVSYWISQSSLLQIAEKDGRQAMVLKEAYRLTEVINAILAEFSTPRTVSSDILRGYDPLGLGDSGLLYITPKSNVLNINHTEPAQKAPITLRQILDMLRTMFRCYWELSGSTLVIEHIEWFRRGGRYTGSPSVMADLTAARTVRNNNVWGYEQNTFRYDKPDMPCRYEFGWMDDATQPFEGDPIEMVSGYVNKERVEKFTVVGFSADLDYLMLNPAGASKDGFAIMKADTYNQVTSPIYRNEDSETMVLLNYAPMGEEDVEVVYSASGSGQVWALDANSRPFALLSVWSTASGASETWTLPAGTAAIALVLTTTSSEYTLEEFYSHFLKVVYWTYAEGTVSESELQNGYLAFAWLERYYFYDMPCAGYKIGDEYENAIGVAKKKTQEVSFPLSLASDYAAMKKTVRTALGYGKIRKLNLNLSSEAAQATLEYDTE